MGLEIVEAVAEMAEELGRIHASSWQAAYKGVIADSYLARITPEARAEAFQRFLQDSDSRGTHLLFRIDGKAAGLATVSASREEGAPQDEGEVCGFYFAPEYWGSGYSRPAMEHCLKLLFEQGYRSALLWVLKDNPRARRFYEKCGFADSGISKEIILDKPLLEVMYRCELEEKLWRS